MKRFILPLILVAIMVATVTSIGVVAVKYAIDVVNQPKPFSWEEMDRLQGQDAIDDKEIPRLLACFDRNDEDLRIKAAETLAKMGKKAVDPVREKLKSKNPSVRFCAVQTLAFMGPEAAGASEDLLGCLQDSDPAVRRKAVYALGRLGGEADAVFEGLLKALSDNDPDVVETALEMLKQANAPPKSALPALTKLAKDPNHDVRSEAMKLLGKMGEPAVPAFKELLTKPDPLGTVMLIHALTPLGAHAKPLLPELQAILITNVWWDNEEELVGIFKKCGPDGVRGMASVLKSLHAPKSPHFANAGPRSAILLKAIGEMGAQGKDATPVLIDLLKERDALRPQVLEALGDIGPSAKEATPAVEALTSDPAVGPAARVALKRMGVIGP